MHDYLLKKWLSALAGNQTQVNCLGSSYAPHYTTNACEGWAFESKHGQSNKTFIL